MNTILALWMDVVRILILAPRQTRAAGCDDHERRILRQPHGSHD